MNLREPIELRQPRPSRPDIAQRLRGTPYRPTYGRRPAHGREASANCPVSRQNAVIVRGACPVSIPVYPCLYLAQRGCRHQKAPWNKGFCRCLYLSIPFSKDLFFLKEKREESARAALCVRSICFGQIGVDRYRHPVFLYVFNQLSCLHPIAAGVDGYRHQPQRRSVTCQLYPMEPRGAGRVGVPRRDTGWLKLNRTPDNPS